MIPHQEYELNGRAASPDDITKEGTGTFLKPIIDDVAIAQLERLTNGSNVHKINNLRHAYLASLQLAVDHMDEGNNPAAADAIAMNSQALCDIMIFIYNYSMQIRRCQRLSHNSIDQ
jgi:hypothetical protein